MASGPEKKPPAAVKVGLRCPESFRRRGVYVVDTLFDILGLRYQLLQDSDAEFDLFWGPLGSEVKSRVLVPLVSPERWEKEEWKVTVIDGVPVLYVGERPTRLYEQSESIKLGFDFLSCFFYLVSRYEEYRSTARDEFGRFRVEDSVLHKLQLLETPVLSIYVSLVREVFQKCGLPGGEPLWPEGERFAVALTHDVDIPRKTVAASLGILFNHLVGKKALEARGAFSQLASAAEVLGARLSGGENPYWNFSKWSALEAGYGFKSCFYLSCAQRKGPKDPSYELRSDGPLQDIASGLYRSGFEIGLHGSFASAGAVSSLKLEKESLQRLCGVGVFGVRQHYLRVQLPSTWRIQEQAGFTYDSSLGYPNEIGFRSGLAFPFSPYHLEEERRLNILELPLNIMDGAVFGNVKGDKKKVLSGCLQLLEKVEKHNGVAVILWHLRSWYERDFPGWRWVYEQILSHLSQKEAWVTSPGEIAKWWRKRSKRVRNN